MSPVAKPSIGWKTAFYAVVCAPMVFLLVNCVRDAYCDVQMIRKAALSTEVSRLRSQANRRASQLELVLALQPAETDWESVRNHEWLKRELRQIGQSSGHDLYAAIVDPTGKIVLHSDESLIGDHLERRWYHSAVPEAGEDVVRIDHGKLANDVPALDVRVPLKVQGREVGEYHEGLDAGWLDRGVAALQREALASWTWVLLLAVAIDAAAALALYRIAQWQARLSGQMQLTEQQRTTQLAQLARERTRQLAQIASGLAHEIRNPLHALRLNLLALDKSVNGKTQLSHEDRLATIRESDQEVSRMETLLRDLIRFASPESGKNADLNVVQEIQATLNLMHEDMKHKEVGVRTHWDDPSIVAWIDPARLRQMLVNLLTFAQNNAGASGWIEVHVGRRGQLAEIMVADSGPPLPQTQARSVFEPFQAPRETGSGLGLALVQTFAAEAGGSASCEPGVQSGNRFRVLLPANCRGNDHD